jgi:uncharacterized membrane-anchored protein YhcB (DUF1043 family)
MLGIIFWIIAVVLGVIGITIAFIINARTLRRDLNQRRETFRARLESDANAIVEHLFRGSEPQRGESHAPSQVRHD